MTKQQFIPVCEPTLNGNEKKYVLEALETNWISSSGKFLNEFEKGFADYCGVKFGVACSSGTAALHLALLALDIKEGDEVILPDFTMVSTLFSILYVGAKPVFVDVEPDTGNIDPGLIEEKITEKTKAIMVVHIYGHPVEIEPINKIAQKHNLKIVEDAAEAHGAKYKGKKCGSLGDIACFSFYGNKIITTGEGGMVVTDNAILAEKCKYFKNLCFPLNGPRNYTHEDLGYNYRMTNIQAAIGVAQLGQMNELKQKRRNNAKLYNQLLSKIPGVITPCEKKYALNVYWMYGIQIVEHEFGMSRDQLAKNLKIHGIDTRLYFQPMHSQPVLKKFGLIDNHSYPNTELLACQGLYLPSGSGLDSEHIHSICKTISSIQQGN